jgi:hypothetical protein
MNLMSQSKELRGHLIPGFTGLIIDVITIRPGKHSLFDQQPHINASFTFYHTIHPLLLQEKAAFSPYNCRLSSSQPVVEGKILNFKRIIDSFFRHFVA